MNNKQYIGLEEELALFNFKGKYKSEPDIKGESYHFSRNKTMKKINRIVSKTGAKNLGKSSYSGTSRFITSTGNMLYCDSSDQGLMIETATPPILINKGFATRLIDAAMWRRDFIINKIPNYQYTGYSMHWNLSRIDLSGAIDSDRPQEIDGLIQDTEKTSLQQIIAPFQMFGLTPLSLGARIKFKKDRKEILGDSIKSEDQIKAMALMLGAHHLNFNQLEDFPKLSSLLIKKDYNKGIIKNIFSICGRDAHLNLENIEEEMPAQDYLERFYRKIKPSVLELGTKDEIKNLEDFIFGKKKLEIDEREYFNYLKEKGAHTNGIYFPLELKFMNKNNSQKLKLNNKKRKIPKENKIMSKIIKEHQVNFVNWANITFNDSITTKGIDELYTYLKVRREK